jgi:type VI secretion system protein ImpJ
VIVNRKVIWREGMFLQPQHFQQAERNIHGIFNSRFAALFPYGYGFTAVSVDADSLQNGVLAIKMGSGIMPDGTYFDIPGNSELPPIRQIADSFSHDTQSLTAYLCLPLPIEGKANITQAGPSSFSASRYSSRIMSVTDEVQGIQKKDIDLAGHNFVLLFENESRDNFTSLPIAKLVRNASGQILIDETFVPPVVYMGASMHLMREIRSLLEILLAKSASLSQGRKQKVSGLAEFKGSEETAFRLLQTVNTYTPLLNHCHVAPSMHPFELFNVLTQFCGALSAFSADVSIKQLPRYEHTSLREVFAIFIQVIRTVLGAELSAGCISVPIEKTGSSTWVCRVADEKLLRTAKFYFGVSASAPEKELLIGTLQRIKMCSRDRLDILIPTAMPGLPMMHVSRPPEGLSTKPGFLYFSLDQSSEFWQGIRASGTLAFYFPNNYQDLKMEILALRE